MTIAAGFRDRPAMTLERARPVPQTTTPDRIQPEFGGEQYRALGHIVEQIGKSDRTVIAISSPVAGDGKTHTCLNLAKAMAESSAARVLAIDADLRRGSLGDQAGLGRALSPGFAGAIANPGLRLSAVTRRLPNSNLTVLPAGACPAVPYEAIRSARAGELLREAKASFDYVLIDAPPVVPVADVRVLTEWVDGFFLVVTAHRTPRGLLDEALSTMDPAKVLGIIYNGDDLPISRRHRYYYSYGQPAPRGFFATLMGEESGR
jgi:capsular exopolysaccharide synthesis family protein